ncbi:hypothetical protein N0V84_008002 [Fusarium piperis]|uniref:Uncharacterized protein n=1 Tax=Fusarium piperis TaxID=1435070 RepID=A0A9W8W8Y2_9HYPO|nr:hypothetical protein N0V84_008002 [Fusarium piperis]
MGALPGMTSLQTLVLSNRNADDTPESGAQSMNNSSPLVKLWREVGEGCRERPPFPPRVEWWAPLQDDQFENDEVFDRNYLVDCLSGYLARNGGTRPIIQELGDDDEALDNETVQSYSDEHGARSDDDDDVNELATNPSSNYIQPLDLSSIPASARALRREARGLHVVTDVLRNDMVLSRLKEFRIDASLDTIADVQTPGLSLRMFDFFAPPFVSRLSTAFAATHLTRVELVLSNGREFMDGQDIIDQGQFGLVLASMPSLQHVMIEAHNMGIIGAIPPNATFPHLRTAEFVCGLVSRQEIRIFLRQHRATIEEFHLFYCSLDGPDDEDLSWSDAVQDIMSLQDTGTINLRAATLISGYESIPFTGCGRNKTKSRPRPGEAVYSWTLGVDNDVVNCPTEDLGHIELPALQP